VRPIAAWRASISANRRPFGILFASVGSCPVFPVKQGQNRLAAAGAIQAAFPWRKYGARPGAEEVLFVAGTP